ncbi:unnamed protein product [Pocillopora meandrina]|uniref:Uncharacterized protein n=1 Tax=Pocillopora meandrina TaxID=46732 RepID=A0AAU9X5L0_9CNID|nr:unnamed protein product [Pocillopora meandrina]
MSYKTLFFFVSVFFTTGYATRWPTFTNCTLTEYLCDTRKCITQFIKNVQNDTEGDCGVQYNKTLACIITSNKICGRVYSSNLSNMTLDDSLRAGISEDQMCKEAFLGEFLVPWHISTLNGYCSRVFVNNTEACLKTFHDKFIANRSDTTLCEAKVNKTINCIRRTYNICFGTDYARHFESVRVQFTETSMCHEGALGLPTSHSLEVLAAHCPESFSTNLNNCLKSFQGTFARDKTDPDLCKEHAKATECVRKLFASTCPKLPTSYRELIDLTFIKNNYNPYCDNNRDPGASKIPDRCNVVRDLDNPWTKLLKNNSTSNINNNSKSAHNITSNTITTPTDDIRREFVSCSPKHINAATGTSINTFQAFFFPCVVLQLFYTV